MAARHTPLVILYDVILRILTHPCVLLFSLLQIVCSRVFCSIKFVVDVVTALLSEESVFSDEFAAVLISRTSCESQTYLGVLLVFC